MNLSSVLQLRLRSSRAALAAAIISSACLAPLSTGCLACNAIGYGPSFGLYIVASEAAPLPAGHYELLVIADGVSWSFECGDPSELGEHEAADCEGSVIAGESGGQQLSAGLLPEQISFEAGRIEDPDLWGIETLEVAVLRDGVELASEVFTPEYQEFLRGSRACGVSEVSERQELSLPSEEQD